MPRSPRERRRVGPIWKRAQSHARKRSRAARTAAGVRGRQPSLEQLEPRHLLSASFDFEAFSALAADDTSESFWWSGWQPQEAPSADKATDSYAAELRYCFSGQPELEPAPLGYYVTLADQQSWVSTGDPIVPSHMSHILLPQGTQIQSLQVTLGDSTVVAAGIDLLAAPAPVPCDQEPDADFSYQLVGENFCPMATYETEYFRGYSVGVLNMFPVSYEAATGTVDYYDEIRVTLTATAADMAGVLPVCQSASDAEEVMKLVDNDTAIAGYQALETVEKSGTLPSAGPFEYVIVAPNSLAAAFQPLVNHKISRGLTATVVTTEYINANYTSPYANENDSSGKVREFLADAYANWGTRWVVLGGDADTGAELGPYRYVKVSDTTFLTDMYFACLDGPYNYTAGSDWGQTNDGTGGGDVDRLPDVYVGRCPASNATEVTNFVNKTILYETTPPPNPTTGLWLGEQLNDDPVTWGGASSDAIIAQVVPSGYTAEKLYERDMDWTTADVKDYLNGSPNFAHHLGHSNYTGNAKLSRSDPPSLTNIHPYFFYSQGCLAGAFQNNDSMAEAHTVKAVHAAYAVILNTHYGWYVPGGLGGSHYWALQFFDALFNEGRIHIGDAHFDSKNDLSSSSGTNRWVFFCSTLFGDPETQMYLPSAKPPKISSSSPSGSQTGPISSLTLKFSEPMDQGSFGLDDIVSFTDPGGYDLRGRLTSFHWRDFWTLDIFFDQQAGAGNYQITIAPDIRDSSGTALDNDGDLIPGEYTQDRYLASFSIAAGPNGNSLAILSHTPHVAEPGAGYVDVTFNRNIQSSSFTTADVQITGPNGPVTVTGVTQGAGYTYRVSFTPQTTLGSYTIVVGPQILDTLGRQMDQDLDGTRGEPVADQYVGMLQIVAEDNDPPAAVSHTPSGRTLPPVSLLDVSFDEPMDTASFSIADVTAFQGPQGNLINQIVGYRWFGTTKLQIAFTAQSTYGNYSLTFGPNVTDDAPSHNPMAASYTAEFELCNTLDYDVVGSYFDVSPDTLTWAADASVAFRVGNRGALPVGPFNVRFYLSQDADINPTYDMLLSTSSGDDYYRVASGLAAGGSHYGAVTIAMPIGCPWATGPAYLGMVVDADDEIAEGNETNNCNYGKYLDWDDVTYETLRNPDNPGGLYSDVYYQYYKNTGGLDSVEQLDSLALADAGSVDQFDIDLYDDENYFGYIYHGYIYVSTAATYTFYTQSDDGSRVYVGGKLVVDNDGDHSAQERSGKIGLKSGYHQITVKFYEDAGVQNFTVSFSSSGTSKQEIPGSALFHVTNSPPNLSSLPDQTLNEGTTLNNAIDLWAYANDAEDSDSQLSFSIVSNTNPDCGVSIDSDRYIDISPTAGWHGISDVTIRVEDRSGYSYADIFRVTVDSVNEPPVISGLPDKTLNEDSFLNNAINLWNYASDEKVGSGYLTYTISGNTNPNCGASIDSNHYVDIWPAFDWYGYSDVTIRVEDPEGAFDTDTFRITVNSVNDPPVVTAITDSPDPVAPSALLTLTATGVSDQLDPEGAVVAVCFYRESNGFEGLQVGFLGDTELGSDSNGLDGWELQLSTAGWPAGTNTYYAQAIDDGGLASADSVYAPSTENTVAAVVKGRHIFYNASAYDGGNPAPNAQDDLAIAPDKVALGREETATFANYTSYSRGINGIMVDIAGLPSASLSPSDFTFRVGNDDNPGGWSEVAELPTIAVRTGAGADASDRVTIVFPDNAIQNQWLQVTVLANANTGLAANDVFYFGNAIGETGDTEANARVDANDILQTRNHPHPFFNPASITCPYDFNRDQRVDATDVLLVRSNQTTFFDDLNLITVPAGKGADSATGWEDLAGPKAGPAPSQRLRPTEHTAAHAAIFANVGQPPAPPVLLPAATDWLYQFDPATAASSLPRRQDPPPSLVDHALADLW